jgi:uncharacterized protein YndB with AHSA1/START domain
VPSFTLVREVMAPPELVFDVFTDHRRYAEMRRSLLERQGEPAPNGVGAIRALHSVGPPLREEMIAYERPRRFAYRVLSGIPVRDHVGTVELTPDGARTKVVYAIRTFPTLPFVGAVIVAVTRLAVQRLLDDVAAESERRTPVGS